MGKRTTTTTTSDGSKSKPSRSGTAVTLANGFLGVPLTIARKQGDVQHWIYVRRHTGASGSKEAELGADRTLFVANLPVDATEDAVRGWFARTGGVSVVKFRVRQEEEEDEVEERGVGEESDEEAAAVKGKKKEKHSRVPRITPLPALDPRTAAGSQPLLPTSSSAHITFLDPLSCTRALESLTKPPRHTASAPTGLTYLLAQHALARPPLPHIASWANSAISLYAYRRAHPLPRAIGVRGVTLGPNGELLDEDGFTIVQRAGGKYGRAAAGEGGSVGIAKSGFKENEKKKSTGLEDFYRFQLRERKREELAGLRARFEEDKRKVERLKGGRRFKPY